MKNPTVNSYFVTDNEENRRKAFNERTAKMVKALLENMKYSGKNKKEKAEA